MVKSWALAGLSCLLLVGAARAESPLADLAEDGEREAALAMIEAGADVNAAQQTGATALHWAAYHGDLTLAAALLEHGADADVVSAYGSAPLIEAANVANLELVDMLLDAGADPDAANREGQTALMIAARTGAVGVADRLLQAGADVNAREQWRGQTALMWAASSDLPEMAELLVARGADVNARSTVYLWERQVTTEPRAMYRPTGGLTALHYAARGGCVRCAQAMIEAGADVGAPTPDGVTGIMIALDNFNFDVARLLIEAGADPHVWDWWGRTALYVAVDMHNASPRLGAPLDNPDEATALDVIAMLLERGVDPNVQLSLHRPDRAGAGRFSDIALRTGATPLLRAAATHDNEVVTALIEGGADASIANVMGVTPLMAAAGMSVRLRDMRSDNNAGPIEPRVIETLQLLLDAGADVNAPVTDTTSWTARIGRMSPMEGREGQTALYAAVENGWADVARFLIEQGARTDVVDAAGRSPLDVVREAPDSEEFVSLLSQASVVR